MKRLLLLLFLSFVGSSFAQSTDRISSAEFGRLWGPALDPAGATQVRNFPSGPSYPVTAAPTITAEAGGGLAVTKSARFPVDPSRVIDVTAKAPITKAAMGKALKGAVALTGGPVGIALFAASEIVDWLNQSGLRQSPTSPGVIEKLAPGSCIVAPCYAYTLIDGDSRFPRRPSLEAACDDLMAWNNSQFPTYGYKRTSVNYSTSQCTYSYSLNPSSTVNFQRYSRTPDTSAAYETATLSDIESLSSAPTMKPEWLRRILDSGVAVDAGNVTLTGPATAAGPSSTSTKQIKDAGGNVTGTQTVTNSTTYNITYNGNTYNVNAVTTTTTVNPDGTSTVETTSQREEPQPSISDTPLPDLPSLYTKKYPNGLEGVWAQKKAELTASPLLNLLSGLMPSVGSSGTCPTMVVPLDVGIADFGSHDFAPPCWIWDFGRVVIIVSALLLARRLIFGG